MASAFELIADQLADPEAQWSLGTFGAIAEFMRDADEPAEVVREEPVAAVVTPRGGVLFDLGLGVLQVDCCIRTSDAALTDGLRAHAGRSLFEHGNLAMGLILRHSPHRVFMTR